LGLSSFEELYGTTGDDEEYYHLPDSGPHSFGLGRNLEILKNHVAMNQKTLEVLN
jgi:hypothetical protein